MKKRAIILILVCLCMAACSGVKPTPTTEPEAAAPAEVEAEEPAPVLEGEPGETQIVIDGKSDDWAGREVVIDDPAGDGEEGYLDLTTTYAFQNQNALYFLIETPDPTLPLVQFDFVFSAGNRMFLISWSPGNPRGFRSEITSGFEEIGESIYSSYALSDALEVRIDLRDFESPERLELAEVRVMVGETCCQFPEWRAADELNPAGTPIVNEVDSEETLALAGGTVQVVEGEGGLPPVGEVNLAERFELPEGYNAEALFAPPAANLTGIVRSESGVIYLHHGAPDAGLSTLDPETGEVTRILDLPIQGAEFSTSGPGDTIYVWNGGNIMQVSPDGSFELWGINHQGRVAATTPDGRLIGIVHQGGSVFEMQPDNTIVEIASNFQIIFDVVAADDGTLYVSDIEAGSITRIDPDGTQTVLAEKILYRDPMDMGIGPDGNLYLNTVVTGFVRVDTETGELTRIAESHTACGPHQADFVFDNSGRVIFVDPTWSVVTWLDIATGQSGLLVSNMGVNTWAMDVGPDDAVYVGGWGCGTELPAQVVRYTDDGSREVVIDGVKGLFNDVSLDPDGGMYVSVHDPDVESYTAYVAPGSTTLARIGGLYGLSAIDFDPVSGHAFGTYHGGDSLIEFTPDGIIAEHPIALPMRVNDFFLGIAPDGVPYVYAAEAERATTGPQVERWVLRLDPEAGTSEVVYSFVRDGCCVMGNLAAGPDGNLYWMVDPEFEIHRVSPDGEATVVARNLPIDPGAVAVDGEGDIYFTSPGGIYRIYQE